ncbi:hypothetical protein NUW58_g939 [Xylaria curta]|uniref:Uncharacterized protein n=1 Tax=Xylaria curta TaxID=42375 RepID=A0ACC1PQR2_9PEZI|nr:hypothetical protein NUW58_g939 [Xylaria curta]
MLESGMSDRQSHLGRQKRPSASASESTPTLLPPTSTPKTGPYDRAFQQLLIDYGIYPNKYEYPDGQALPPPGNLEEIIQAIVKTRPSLSLSRFNQQDFKQFERADAHALKKAQIISTILPIIEGDIKDGRSVAGQVPFTNLEDPTNNLLVPGNPDRYYGARPEQLDRQVRMQLNKHIVLSTQHDFPIVPNFFLNVKGLDGTLAVAGRQACYDGALGARGIQSLQVYSDPRLDLDNNAYTITSMYQKGYLNIYATYPLSRASPEMPREYAMTQIKAYALTSDVDTFRIGAARAQSELIKGCHNTSNTKLYIWSTYDPNFEGVKIGGASLRDSKGKAAQLTRMCKSSWRASEERVFQVITCMTCVHAVSGTLPSRRATRTGHIHLMLFDLPSYAAGNSNDILEVGIELGLTVYAVVEDSSSVESKPMRLECSSGALQLASCIVIEGNS